MRTLAYGVVLFTTMISAARSDQGADALSVYVGTYTGTGSQGIYRFQFDTETGAPSGLQLVAETPNPSFLAFAPDGKHLYAVNEIDQYDGKPSGSVSSFGLRSADEQLTFINRQPSRGGSPCHLVVDKEGKNVLVANYGGGSTTVIPIGAGGSLERPSSSIQHQGKVADRARQGGPHAHSVNLDAAGKFAFVADLGLDQILIYKLDSKAGTIEPNVPASAALDPRSGPRHFAFHPDGRHAYVINEISLTVTAWNYDPGTGTLTSIQTISTLPKDVKANPSFSTADVHVHPSGSFLYGSNRGQNSIVVYQIDPSTGKLTYVENQGEGIKTPRNFTIDPTGKFLLVANQDGNSVVVFQIDQKTGKLTSTGQSIKVPTPVCLKFVPTAK